MILKKIVSHDICIYSLEANVNLAAGKAIAELVTQDSTDIPHVRKFAFDCGNKFTIETSAFRCLTKLALQLKLAQKSIFILHPSKELASFVREMGLVTLMKPMNSIAELGAEVVAMAPTKSYTLDDNFTKPFIQSTVATFKVQFNLDCEILQITPPSKINPEIKVDIAGIIGWVSKAFQGSITICFPKKVFLSAMTIMMGEECTEINEELEQGAAELVNIIFGHAKKSLNEQGHTIETALPNVIRGQGIDVRPASAKESVLVEFKSAIGSFYIQISIN